MVLRVSTPKSRIEQLYPAQTPGNTMSFTCLIRWHSPQGHYSCIRHSAWQCPHAAMRKIRGWIAWIS